MARLPSWPVRVACLYCFAVMAMAAATSNKRSAGGTAPASFTETQDGQLAVVTSGGAPINQHQHVQEAQEEKESEEINSEAWKTVHKEDMEAENRADKDRAENPSRSRRSLSRRKRFMDKSKWYVWPKGIVPYDFNMEKIGLYYKHEAISAMTRWHKYTCIRFVPWVLGETKEKYGLTEESHITFTKGDGCAASQGNHHNARGQYNSCCSRGVCTHEIGHSLALYHEHQSPWRDQLITLDISHVPGDLQWTYRKRYDSEVEIYQYDITNTMHYGGAAFYNTYEDLKPLIKFGNQYYMYKDVSLFHDCKGLFCANFTSQCHNDGFVTLVDDQCSCLCPPGLDSSTGCTTTVKQVSSSFSWPAGSFGLFATSAGCPGNEFLKGGWQHQGQGNNRKSDPFHLGGSFDANIFRYNFCVKEDSGSDPGPDWETGRYCILRVNGQCPKGFEPGSIQFDDHVNSTGQAEGRLPDGQFTDTQDTRLDFCCRDDGFVSTPLVNLPNAEPLVLLMGNKTSHCQEVAGMRWTEEYMWFDSYRDNANMSGSHPHVSRNTFFKIWFCYYVPMDYNCGGEITLTKNNTQAVITSPNFPSPYGTNMECTWLIKADEEGGRVLLNFDVMKITSHGDDCKDSLEIRYNIPGQPGIRYCGDGLGRTIRSLNNTVLLTLRSDSDQVTTDIGFNLTASLYLTKEDGCYEPSTKGRLYRGQMNYTRGIKACLPWTEVTNCQYHAFHPRDFGSGLEENYCRNPDNTAMPWCYVDKECNRDYCDVCNIERIYDVSPLCPSTVCEKSEKDILKLGCARSCAHKPTPAPDRGAKCGMPKRPPDARFGDDAPCISNSSAVGTAVSLQCSTGPEYLNLTCLGDGQWSPAGYVCGACADGWAFFNGSCYKHFWPKKTFAAAREVCASHGGLIASMKNKEEMAFVSSLRQHLWTMWIGATDIEVEGEYRWEDGTLVDWFNWHDDDINNSGQDCVEAYTDYFNTTWNDQGCTAERPFVCKYGLSERRHCANRHRSCGSVLLTSPEVCTQHPDFANQMCPYSCGLCLTEQTPQCNVSTPGDNVTLVSPQGQQSVTRGSVVQYACREGFVLTQGQLSLACGADGQLIGTLPVCTDPDTIIQDSNDVDLVQRPSTTSGGYAYTSLGSNLGITRNGVIKQWKFYSPQKGFTFFQVWRPNPAGGNLSFTLVGQNQVLTQGQGAETYDVEEADWITVQPGDRIGLFETGDFRGRVPYTYCNKDSYPGDFGVAWSLSVRYQGDFSPSQPHEFSSKINCRRFSFKAVIHPVTSIPAEPDIPTSQVAVLSRYYTGSSINAYLGDSANFYIPAEGYVKEWQFFAKHNGTGAFQVWRRRPDQGVRNFQLIGQNKVNVTSNEPGLHTLKVPKGERIAVQAGDIIGFLYGDDKLGIPYSLCSEKSYPESYNISWFTPLTPDTAFIGDVYSFSYTGGSYLCRVFSFRAIVEQGQATPVPRPPDIRTSDVAIISRPDVGAHSNVYLGDSNNFYIPVDGYVKEWQFFARYGGTGAFQVWRRREELGTRQYELVGQNAINITTSEARVHKFNVPEGERIAAKAGDIIGFLYGADRLGLPYTYCNDVNNTDSNNIYWYEPLAPDTAVIGDVYHFSYTGGQGLCRIFSLRAVIEQAIPQPGPPDLPTSDRSLTDRTYVGDESYVFLGDSSYYYVPADGHVKEWQFFARSGGSGAFQVWRLHGDKGEGKFQLIGQNKINITTSGAGTHRFGVSEGERIAVKAGDIIGFLYGEGRLSIPYSLCDDENDTEFNNIFWYTPLTPDTAAIGDVYPFSSSGGRWKCRIFSFRAIIKQAGPPAPSYPDLRTNDMALVSRSRVGSAVNVYLGDSKNYYIPADGQVKEWQFFSKNAGSGAFQVWRRRDDRGVRQFQLIGQNPINLTSNEARPYTFAVPESERITVKAGDIIGFLYGPGENKLGLPYNFCDDVNDPYNKNTSWFDSLTPETAFVGDVYQFSYTGGSSLCRVFSFRAIVKQTIPEPRLPDLRTSDMVMLDRRYVGDESYVFLGDNRNFYIPADGYVKEWQFFAKFGGSGAFQVWRRRDDKGERKFQLIGQNKINITTSGAGTHRFNVSEGERIAVKTGDIIGFLYGKGTLGIPYSLCEDQNDPDNNNICWFTPLAPETAVIGDVYPFSSSSGDWKCRIFSFRAVVQQAPPTPEPSYPDLRTSDSALISRSSVGSGEYVYVGDSYNYYIPADGQVKEWQFFSKHAGSGAFQVWRRRDDQGVRKFQLIGQNAINLTSSEARPYTFPVAELERIDVKAGDIIGFLYGENELGLPYSLCGDVNDPNNKNVSWYGPTAPETIVIGDVYQFSYSGGSYLCRIFSFRAVVKQSIPGPTLPDLHTSDVALVDRKYLGGENYVFLGDSQNYYVPADGLVKEWQFFSRSGGSGAFQVWRSHGDKAERKFELIGQNKINITTSGASVHMFEVPEGERIVVKAGDIIGFLYGEDLLGIPYSFCDDVNDPSSNNIYWYTPLTPDTAAIGDVYQFSNSDGNWKCRFFSFRAVIKQATKAR